jgi:hypothetical protein
MGAPLRIKKIPASRSRRVAAPTGQRGGKMIPLGYVR